MKRPLYATLESEEEGKLKETKQEGTRKRGVINYRGVLVEIDGK